MADSYGPYLKQAQALFDSGDVVKAGQIWQAILKREPEHEEARAGLYKVKVYFDARATQGGLKASEENPFSEPLNRRTLTPPSPEINSLLDAGCALYDAGLIPKAISTWEMALHQDPGNALAKGYIDGARRKLEAENPPPPPIALAEPAAPAPRQDDDEVDKLLRDGCTLFDMGQAEDALRKWERILALDPGHALALAYTNDARKDLGLAPLAAGEARPAAQAPAPAAAQEPPRIQLDGDLSSADQLVREGVQIYDMGMVEEAQEKWRTALELAPGHPDAQGYLQMALRDAAQAPPSRPVAPPRAAAPPPAAPAPVVDPLQARIVAAENLLRNHKLEEAAFAFQLLLEAGSTDPRVLQGYQQARSLVSAQEPEPAVIREAPAAVAPPAPVDPPRALTTKPPARGGLKLPATLSLPAWFARPANLALLAGAILVLILAAVLLRAHHKDVALREAVVAAKALAQAPAERAAQVAVLTETAADIRAEGDRVLADDPLTAYYRAQECLRLDSGDAAAAQLLERARARMAAAPPAGAGTDLDAAMKSGDLPAARATVGDLLRRSPDDAELKARARTIYLALAQSLAANDKFSEARDLLRQGRAMFPQDKTWPAKEKLLEDIQTMARPARTAWIPLLG